MPPVLKPFQTEGDLITHFDTVAKPLLRLKAHSGNHNRSGWPSQLHESSVSSRTWAGSPSPE